MSFAPIPGTRSYLVPPEYLFGPGSSREHLSNIEEDRVFLVTDIPAMETAGHLGRVMDILKSGTGRTVGTLSIEAEPSFQVLKAAVEAVRRFSPERIVALGGGSVMDTAKALWRLSEDRSQDPEDFLQSGPVFPQGGRTSCRLSAIPTTSGTGSEVTCAAVFTEKDGSRKRLLLSPLLVPGTAVLDPDLTLSMPPRVAAASGFDAFVHAVESYLCSVATPFSRSCAVEAVRLVFSSLKESCASGNPVAREAMHYAASLAGLAISNSCTGVTHSLDQVGIRFHLPHGIILAPLALPMLEVAAAGAPARLADLASAAGIDFDPGANTDDKARLFIERTAGIISSLGLPLSFSELGIDEHEYNGASEEILSGAFEAFATRVFPSALTREDLSVLLKKAYRG